MNMRFTPAVFSICLFAANANAQLVTISAANQFPVIGDSIHYVDANNFGFDPTGVGPVTAKVWDESAIFATGTTYDFVYDDPALVSQSLGRDSFPSATLARRESGAPGYFYYQNTASDINRLGWFASATNYGIYTNGTVAREFHFPITAGQTYTSTYQGVYAPFGVGEDSVRITSGSVSINADMQGQLILPYGSFSNVLRLHVMESFHIQTYILGFVATDDVIADDYYYWFVEGTLQAVMVYGTTSTDGTPQASVFRYQDLSTTGVAELHADNFFLHPNPSNGKIRIDHEGFSLKDFKFEICNAVGEKILFARIEGQTEDEIDISSSPKGIYFVRISNGKETRVKKFVLQ